MPYTTHGHWYGDGEPTGPRPNLIARCGGPYLHPECTTCRAEAGTPLEPRPVSAAQPGPDGPAITDEQYIYELQGLLLATRAILELAEATDISALRTICSRFEALGPILEPAAYQRGGMRRLRDQATFLAALDEFVTKVRSLDDREASR